MRIAIFLLALLTLMVAPQLATDGRAQSMDSGQLMANSETTPAPFAFYKDVRAAHVLNYPEICQEIEYPTIAADAGIEGSVQIRVLVDENGKYKEHLLMSSPDPLLTKSVKEQLKSLHFQPAECQGKQVPCWVSLRFNFVVTE